MSESRWSETPGTPEAPVLDGTMLRAGHLGGYHVGGDPLSVYPHLWRWLVVELGVRSVIDVGCGEGYALQAFADLGVDIVLGIDGIAQPDARQLIRQHDYTEGPWGEVELSDPGWRFDLCWSCEFVEHVEERFMPNYLQSFALADLVLMTHALPGQGGHHHVNTREDDYWAGALAAIGYTFDDGLTGRTRELAGQGYYAFSGLAFRRVPLA